MMDTHWRVVDAVGRVVAVAVFSWLGVTTLTGCGYSQEELYPTEVQSVNVPIFENKTFYRDVEFDLNEAIVKEIELRTPYKVVSHEAEADTKLTGSIVEVHQSQRSRRRPGGLPQEMEVTVVVDFEWRNLRNQSIMRERRGFPAVGSYIPTAELGEPFEVAQHQAVQRMATDIVSTMRADW